MNYPRFLLALFAIAFATASSAQEVLFPLNSNPALKKAAANNQHMRMSSMVDTASIPFVEDFSLFSVYPTDSLWLDRDVYVNNNYSSKAVTIGVGTFDGLDEFGDPYHPNASGDSIADFLTSRPIRLLPAPGDSTAWLSFFYEGGGLGDIPEPPDSIVLQFKDTGNVWTNVWAIAGRLDTGFHRVTININNPIYLFDGFQFRFYNIATSNGNRDHWNLDYIILEKNSVTPINDFGFIHPQQTLLNEFTAMPYSHYTAPNIAASMMKNTVDDTIRNFDYGPSSVAPYVRIEDSLGGLSIYSYPSLIVGLNLQHDTGYTIPLNAYTFPIHPGDSMEFKVKSYSDSPVNQNKLNDSSSYTQQFYNYYSYDNGSAEVAYGLTGNTDVWMAYQYNVKVQDTLRGVQIYFNPTGINVANKLFQLAVWSDVNVGNNSHIVLYRMINQKPDTFDGINVFKTYIFDTTLVVGPGNIWVGIIQNEPQTLYGIGFDRNTDSRDKMCVHFDGHWYQSQIAGSWMMRPFFGKRVSLVGVEEAEQSAPTFSIYPNPAKNILNIRTDEQKKLRYEILNSVGAIVQRGNIDGPQISLTDLASGIYIIRVVDERNNFSTRTFVTTD